jgi:hypothetical protein
MAKSHSGHELLTPNQASEALGRNVTAYAIRKRVREGALACHWQQATPGKIFVKRSELMKLYAPKIKRWKQVKN